MSKTTKTLLIISLSLVVVIATLLATKPFWKKGTEPNIDEVDNIDGEETEIIFFDDEDKNENNNEDDNHDVVVIVPDDYLGYSENDFKVAIIRLGLRPEKQSATYKSPTLKTGEVYSYESTSDGKEFKKGDSVKYWLVDNSEKPSENNNNNNNNETQSGNNSESPPNVNSGQEDVGIIDNGDGSYTLPEISLE